MDGVLGNMEHHGEAHWRRRVAGHLTVITYYLTALSHLQSSDGYHAELCQLHVLIHFSSDHYHRIFVAAGHGGQ